MLRRRSNLRPALSMARPVKIGKRAVAWPQSVIDAWITDRKAEAGLGAG